MKQQKPWKRILSAGIAGILVAQSMALTSFAAAPTEPEAPAYPYLDTGLSFEERAADLVSRMTLDEKIGQMGNFMDAVPRLGVKGYNLWSEGIHGIWNLRTSYLNEGSTSFPTSVAISNSWNPELYQQEAGMISDEARGFTAKYDKPLSYWSPTINLSRDPRWGRNDEGYGEDPFLTAQMGGAFVNGMQGSDPDGYLKVISTIKHFAANNSEGNRLNGSADMDDRDLYEYYTRAFKDITERNHPGSLMTSYNAINGTPNTVNQPLVTGDLRHKWGFDGYVTSDDTALNFTYSRQKWSSAPGVAPSAYDTAQAALKAGVDSACSSGEYKNQCKKLIQDGVITEADVDRAVIRVFTGRMATGEFDADKGPYGAVTQEEKTAAIAEIEAQDHADMALKTAQESIVLLQNTNNVLPLDQSALDGKKVAVIGSFGKRLELGGYSGNPTVKKTFYTGIEEALAGSGATLAYDEGAKAGSTAPYLFNLDWFEVGYSDGKESLKIEAESYASQTGGIIKESNGKTLGNIKDGCYTVYNNIDLNQMNSFRVSAAGDFNNGAGGGVVEAHWNALNGPLMASAKMDQNTGGWQTYQTFTGEVGTLNYSEPGTIYMVYKRPAADSVSAAALELARTSDVILLSAGTSHDGLCKEGVDRANVVLPYAQEQMIIAVAEEAKKADPNKKVIVQMNTVGMQGVEAFKDKVDAIVWSGYNGQAQGTAAASVIFGGVNPSGRLSATWYKDDGQIPNIYNYNIRDDGNGLGRTYMYAQDSQVAYPFGYGLSYTDFTYENLKIDKTDVTPDDQFTVSVDVTNSGDADGAEVVQLYVATPDSAAALDRPAKRLKGFDKVELAAGETKTVTIEVDCADLYFWDMENARQTFDQGTYEIQVGHSSQDIRETGSVEMSGDATVTVKHATLDTDNFVLEPGGKANTSLVVALSDETFADNAELAITYTSSNEDAVTVDANGVVTGAGNGVALITATAVRDGVSVSDSVAVVSRVPTVLEGIKLDGVSLLGFSPDVRAYSVAWPAGSALPTVTATVKTGLTATVTQATAEAPVATIAVSNGEETVDYTVTFGKQSNAISDEFTSDTLNPAWQWKFEDSAKHRYEKDQGLTITVQGGDLYQNMNSAKNIVVQDADGDWTMDTKVNFSASLDNAYQQAGLIVYADQDNFVKLDYEYTGSGRAMQFSREVNQKRDYQKLANLASVTEIYFRMTKSGNQYAGYYSTDGANFTKLGDTIAFNTAADPQIGMVAYGSSVPVDATFRYFRVTSDAYDTDLAAAADAVNTAVYASVSQADCATEDAVRAHVERIAADAVDNAAVDLTVNTESYVAAQDATEENPAGTDGQYTFTVTTAKDGRSAVSARKTIAITPKSGDAARMIELTADRTSVRVGGDVTVTVTAKGGQFVGAACKLSFESGKFAVKSAPDGWEAIDENAYVYYNVINSGFYPEDTVLGEFVFTAEEQSSEVTGTFTLSDTYLADEWEDGWSTDDAEEVPNNGSVDVQITLAPAYEVEIVEDYVAGYSLVLVYTDNEAGAYTYDGKAMYDVTDAGYLHEGNGYTRVYGLVVKGMDADPGKVASAAESAGTLIYSTDVNGSNTTDLNDAVAVVAVYNANGMYLDAIHMDIVLKSDVNKDKKVDVDDFGLVKAEYTKEGSAQ